ncbi:MAG: bifunctional glutamate N-acetyltransferase/amino-acid acetyltransferase ArgJ [Ignavibacterium sp.]
MLQYIENGSVTSIKEISASGIYCGIKKKNKDLALIYSKFPCVAAGTFTLNKVKAAPVLISKKIIDCNSQDLNSNDGKVRAILINSGNANACTGQQGYDDAIEIQNYCAEKLFIKPEELIVSSTGVIGQRLPVETIKNGINKIIPTLNSDGGLNAAEAILTTDLKPKSFAIKVKLTNGEITIGGICKGSGMIMPNMATMLAFLTTDVVIEKSLLQKALNVAVDNSFNKISVDGETSTNDMVIILSNGISDILIEEDSEDYKIFLSALTDICQTMAKSIVADGEGSTKFITLSVKNAKTKCDADKASKAIANSPLVKTAFYGKDANWGRILSAIGNSGIEFEPDLVAIKFDDVDILTQNYTVVIDEEKAKEVLLKKEFTVEVNLNMGRESTTFWTCDLTEDYVKINANYRT